MHIYTQSKELNSKKASRGNVIITYDMSAVQQYKVALRMEVRCVIAKQQCLVLNTEHIRES